MGGEHWPVIVYGFKTDIIFVNDDEFSICVGSDPGEPIYTSIIINETDVEKVLEKINKYKEENHKDIVRIEKWAKEKGEKYNRNYECKWQLALCGDLEYYNFELEEDMLKEMSDYNSEYDSD